MAMAQLLCGRYDIYKLKMLIQHYFAANYGF